ncbi:MAG: STAS domain-containing protein [Proteobacteria bacterium]|nr:STAS domain-containing protein [Pseudomonadota bacterium]MBU1715482.1 STAS domain-containing protein [Pseudomonadota bacterium]
MQITVGSIDGEIVVINLVGDLVAATAEELKRQVSKLIQKNFNHIIVEMGSVNFMDSSGLGACMAIHKMVQEHKGMIIYVKPNDTVAKVFRITRADKKLSLLASKGEAQQILTANMMNGG